MPNTITFKAEREAHALDALVEAGRKWLQESGFHWSAPADGMSIISVVHSQVEGGWPAFVKARSDECEIIWLLMVRRFGLDFVNRIFWCA